MWDVRACRSCLTVKGKLEKIGDASKRQYTAITGLQMSDSDGYPSYFCMECRHHIRKSLAFRRKSRRAHFVLKEIMTVRKQISFSDIVTVNRKKTNLESSLSFWQPDNNACYLIANEEGQNEETETSLKKYNLTQRNYTKTYSEHLVEITPERIEEPPEINETAVEQEENGTQDNEGDNNTFNDDIPTNDYLEPELDTSNIDMNDIFKDFKEEQSDEDVEQETNEPEHIKRKKVYVSDGKGQQTILDMLVSFDLRVLSLEEQREKMEVQRRTPPFLLALYKCAVCLTVHKSMPELLEHVKYHNERKFDHECNVCKNKYPTEEELNKHLYNFHVYEYTCRLCLARAYSQGGAVKHMREQHNNARPPTCEKAAAKALRNFTLTPLSQQMMSEVMALKSRKDNVLAAKDPAATPNEWYLKNRLKCDICGIWLQLRQDLEKHMILKHRYTYTCKLCKEVVTTRDQAVEHVSTHSEKYECEDCGKTFAKFKGLRMHRENAHIVRIPCNLCGRSWRGPKQLYKHQLRKHGYISVNDALIGDEQQKCEQCGVQFADKRSLETHLVDMNHTGAENIQLACVPCKKLFENEEQLETHLITCMNIKRYPRECCYCSEVLHNGVEYKSHFVERHPTLQYRYVGRNSICDVCGKSVFKPLLEAHLKTHSGGAFECRLCPTVTTTPASHVAHVLACHAARPYRCGFCPRRFKHRSNCKDHILKVHAPTKLYKCEFCGVEFSFFPHLKDHSVSHHNLTIASLKPKALLKSKHKIFIFAHMKIEINELEREVVEKTTIELLDYLEQKSKPVDYKNFFIFNPDAEENIVYKKKISKKRRKKIKSELENAVAQITGYREQFEANEVFEDKKAIKDNVLAEANEFDEANEAFEDKETIEASELTEIREQVTDMEVDQKELGLDSVVEMNDATPLGDGMKVDKDTDILEGDSSMPLEVIESDDGNQYVMIDGEMYRIACDEDE